MTGAARAALLEIALRVCADVKENDSLKARQSAPAEAIARAFHVSFTRASWSGCEEPPNGDLQQIRPRPGQM